MKKIKYFGLTCLAVVSVFCFLAGCEDDSNTGIEDMGGYASESREDGSVEFTLDPVTASADSIGKKISFNVRGGRAPYTWSLANTGSGTLVPSSSGNNRVSAIYTVAALANNTVTVSDSAGRKATAAISGGSSDTPSLQPSSVTHKVNVSPSAFQDTFVALNGVPPYTGWVSSRPDVTALSGTSGSQVTVTTTVGTNDVPATITISAQDSRGYSATASIVLQ